MPMTLWSSEKMYFRRKPSSGWACAAVGWGWLTLMRSSRGEGGSDSFGFAVANPWRAGGVNPLIEFQITMCSIKGLPSAARRVLFRVQGELFRRLLRLSAILQGLGVAQPLLVVILVGVD